MADTTEREKLIAFARAALDCFWEGDGTMQEMGEKHGLLIPTEAKERCGEHCSCADYGEFPTTCYRFAPFLKRVAIDGQEPRDVPGEWVRLAVTHQDGRTAIGYVTPQYAEKAMEMPLAPPT